MDHYKEKKMEDKLIRKYMLLPAILFLVIFLCPVKAEAASKSSVTVTGTCDYAYAYRVLTLVNKQRSKAGAASLTMDKDLLETAMMRAAECSVNFDHIRPNGNICFTASSKMYGENIAYGYSTPSAVMTVWMNSSGHKANILNASYSSIGIGCFYQNGERYWVQCFGIASADKVSQPANSKNTYKVALSSTGETKLTATMAAKTSKTDPLKKKVSGLSVVAGKKKLTIKWTKKSGVSGYQIQISANKSFKNATTYTVNKNITKKIIKKCNGTRLKSKKKYYVRIRAYIKSTGTGGKTVKRYSKWQSTSKKTK